jgi:hypothetical protein
MNAARRFTATIEIWTCAIELHEVLNLPGPAPGFFLRGCLRDEVQHTKLLID